VIGAVRSILHPCKRQLLAWRVRAASWLHDRGLPVGRSPEARAFGHFKAARAGLAAPDLSRLHAPAEPGLVSIVLPVYNGERYLREAIDSVLAQTYAAFELIVVDDGSTDRTPGLLAEYAARDSRVRVLTQANQKLPAALSAGFATARGEFLTWTSADNRLRPEFLTRMVACLQPHPDWDMIYANEDIIDEHGRPLRNSPWYPLYQRPQGSQHLHFPTDGCELNVRFDNFVGGAFLYRARVPLLLGDYGRQWFGLEDYEYWMRVNALLTLRHSDFVECVYEYRFHPESLTSLQGELAAGENRARLLATDAARRKSWLRPLRWTIETDDHPASRELANQLAPAPTHAPEAPAVYVRIAANAGEVAPVSTSPAAMTKVLIVVGETPLPEATPSDWDLCIAWSVAGVTPGRSNCKRSWLVTDDLPTLASAIDIRTRAKQCRKLEAAPG
jgi:hypothetical protein